MKELLTKDKERIVINARGNVQIKLVLLILKSLFKNDEKRANYIKEISQIVLQVNRFTHREDENLSKEFLYIYKTSKLSYNKGSFINRKYFEQVKSGKIEQYSNGISSNIFFSRIKIKEYRLIKTKEFVIEYGSSLFDNNPENLKNFCDKFENKEEYNILKLLKLIKFYE